MSHQLDRRALLRPDRRLPAGCHEYHAGRLDGGHVCGSMVHRGASAADPVGTATLGDITVTTSTAPDSAQYIDDLMVKNVTVGGAPVTA